ncbi:MAG: hypothetical protein Q4G64_07380 [bacterium]|nr:hypothetical protein [bacterium]
MTASRERAPSSGAPVLPDDGAPSPVSPAPGPGSSPVEGPSPTGDVGGNPAPDATPVVGNETPDRDGATPGPDAGPAVTPAPAPGGRSGSRPFTRDDFFGRRGWHRPDVVAGGVLLIAAIVLLPFVVQLMVWQLARTAWVAVVAGVAWLALLAFAAFVLSRGIRPR